MNASTATAIVVITAITIFGALGSAGRIPNGVAAEWVKCAYTVFAFTSITTRLIQSVAACCSTVSTLWIAAIASTTI